MKTKSTSTITSLFALVLSSCLVLGMTDMQAQLDYGDAPDIPYATLSANNGARHMAIDPLLGLVRDSEADGQPNATATGDDIVGSPDDEDGVSFPDILFPGFADNKVSVRTSGTGPFILNAWMDFNGDGDWSDAGEQIFTDRPLVLGANSLLYTVPPGRCLLRSILGGGSILPEVSASTALPLTEKSKITVTVRSTARSGMTEIKTVNAISPRKRD